MKDDQILARKLNELFSDIKSKNGAIDILNECGKEDCELEAIRVKLATLKLSGSNLDRIIEFTDTAKLDFREILSWAKYPRQCMNLSVPEGKKKQKLINDDKTEYRKWLNA